MHGRITMLVKYIFITEKLYDKMCNNSEMCEKLTILSNENIHYCAIRANGFAFRFLF